MSPPSLPGSRPAAPAALRYVGIAVIALVVAGLGYGVYYGIESKRVERAEIHDAIAQVKDAALGTHDAGAGSASAPTTPLAQAMLKLKGLVVTLNARMAVHEAAMDKLHVEDILSAPVLADQARAREAKGRMAKFVEINQAIEADYDDYMQNAQDVLSAAFSDQDAMRRGFEAKAGPMSATLKNSLALNIELAGVVTDVLTLADTHHDKIQMQNGQLVIAGKTWDQYHASMQKIDALMPKLQVAEANLKKLQGDLTQQLNDAEAATR